MIESKSLEAYYYDKRKETGTQSTNDRRETQHHPDAPAGV